MTTVDRARTTCGTSMARRHPAQGPALLLVVLAFAAGCDGGPLARPAERRPDAAARVDAARLAAAPTEAGQWLTTGRTAHEERYSPLAQIDARNVGRLGFAWEYRTGTQRGLEATPIVVDGMLYASGNFGAVYALDAATGRPRWTWDPRVPGAAARKACCDAVNRGVAAWQGRIYVATLDGRLVALDATTGEVDWEADTIVDHARGYTSTGAPRIAGGVVVIGNAGAEAGVRGYVSAYDAATGALAWRFFTVPASSTGPFEHPELARAAATWDPDSRWDAGGGGTAWDGMAYDAELDLLYVGTGNATPYPAHVRSPRGGDNLYVSSILAIRPANGRLAWHYQTTPGDQWDYTATQNIILATLELDGVPRRVLMQAPKNGFFYVLDRETGKLISAEKYAQVTWASHVDLATGRPAMLPAADYREKPALVFPSNQGAHNWQPMAFHPGTGLVYIPVRDVGMTFKAVDRYAFDLASSVNDGLDYAAIETTAPKASLLAWDPRRRQAAWRVDHGQVRNGGLLATAGNLVLQGTVDGRLTAYRANDGRQLLSLDTGTSIMAAPATYAVDGTQYVVVMAGYGGSGLKHYPEGSAARRYGNEGRILAFRLDGGPVPLPPEKDWDAGLAPLPPLPELTAAERGRARQKFFTHCFVCHNLADEPAGYPNLLRLDAAQHARFREVVIGGALESRGMAGFADVLTDDDARVIQGLLVELAHAARARKGASAAAP